MANSPKPGIWILEKSVDHGQTFTPWHYFADNDAECHRVKIHYSSDLTEGLFGALLQVILMVVIGIKIIFQYM